jgi:hypothetical protein
MMTKARFFLFAALSGVSFAAQADQGGQTPRTICHKDDKGVVSCVYYDGCNTHQLDKFGNRISSTALVCSPLDSRKKWKPPCDPAPGKDCTAPSR